MMVSLVNSQSAVSKHWPGRGIFLIALIWLFSLPAFSQLAPRFNSVVVIDEDRDLAVGSATEVLLGTIQNEMYFVTAAHVVENSKNLVTSTGHELKLIGIDSSMDLAVLSAPLRSPFSRGVSISFDQEITTAAFDVDAVSGLSDRQLILEGLDLRRPDVRGRGTLNRHAFQGKVVRSRASGIPGREGTGELLMVSGSDSIPGYSGGVLLESLGTDAIGPRERVLGIVLAVDGNGRQMVVLPQHQILSGFHKAILNPRQLEVKVAGGVRYRDVNAVHYRNSSFLYAGLRPHDAGSGRSFDGGTGRAFDGTSSLAAPAKWSSGIVFDQMPERRYLSLFDFWTEGEPFPLRNRPLLSGVLEGIYEEGGRLFSSSARAPMPVLLHGNQGSQGCSLEQAAVVHSGNQVRAFSCVNTTERESRFTLGLETNPSRWTIYQIRLEKNCSVPGSPCEVQLTARKRQSRLRISRIEAAETFSRNFRGSLAAASSDGIRTFDFQNEILEVDAHGGYRVRSKGRSQNLTAGPLVQEVQP